MNLIRSLLSWISHRFPLAQAAQILSRVDFSGFGRVGNPF
jgi:hypothetical protein